MREITCVVCGKKVIDKSGRQNKKYCSVECANAERYNKWLESQKNVATCPYNDGVRCDDPWCIKCGWSPDVEKQRKERLLKGSETHKEG